MKSLFIAQPVGGSEPQCADGQLQVALLLDAVATSVRLRRWGLGFRQFSFRLIARVLQDEAFSDFQPLPLLQHALVPTSFRFQVS